MIALKAAAYTLAANIGIYKTVEYLKELIRELENAKWDGQE